MGGLGSEASWCSHRARSSTALHHLAVTTRGPSPSRAQSGRGTARLEWQSCYSLLRNPVSPTQEKMDIEILLTSRFCRLSLTDPASETPSRDGAGNPKKRVSLAEHGRTPAPSLRSTQGDPLSRRQRRDAVSTQSFPGNAPRTTHSDRDASLKRSDELPPGNAPSRPGARLNFRRKNPESRSFSHLFGDKAGLPSTFQPSPAYVAPRPLRCDLLAQTQRRHLLRIARDLANVKTRSGATALVEEAAATLDVRSPAGKALFSHSADRSGVPSHQGTGQ